MSALSAAFERFFVACDIPAQMVLKYASRFVKERIHPALMKDLGKEDLRELGVSALGDQLAIMRYIKQCDGNPPEFNSTDSKRKSNSRVQEAVNYGSDEDEPMIVDSLSNSSNNPFKAPDREDIYHVKMPLGTLPKTRKLLEKNRFLRDQGVLKRGVSGIRRSGIELSKPLNVISARSKVIGRKVTKIQDTDITSSTVPLGSMRSDSISTRTTVVTDNSVNSQNSGADERVSLAKRFASFSGPTNIRVHLGKGAVSAAIQPSQRRLIARDIGDFSGSVEEGHTEVIRVRKNNCAPQPFRAPIAERIQIVGQHRSRRPLITVRGNKMLTMDNARGVGQRSSVRASILDRITVTK